MSYRAPTLHELDVAADAANSRISWFEEGDPKSSQPGVVEGTTQVDAVKYHDEVLEELLGTVAQRGCFRLVSVETCDPVVVAKPLAPQSAQMRARSYEASVPTSPRGPAGTGSSGAPARAASMAVAEVDAASDLGGWRAAPQTLEVRCYPHAVVAVGIIAEVGDAPFTLLRSHPLFAPGDFNATSLATTVRVANGSLSRRSKSPGASTTNMTTTVSSAFNASGAAAGPLSIGDASTQRAQSPRRALDAAAEIETQLRDRYTFDVTQASGTVTPGRVGDEWTGPPQWADSATGADPSATIGGGGASNGNCVNCGVPTGWRVEVLAPPWCRVRLNVAILDATTAAARTTEVCAFASPLVHVGAGATLRASVPTPPSASSTTGGESGVAAMVRDAGSRGNKAHRAAPTNWVLCGGGVDASVPIETCRPAVHAALVRAHSSRASRSNSVRSVSESATAATPSGAIAVNGSMGGSSAPALIGSDRRAAEVEPAKKYRYSASQWEVSTRVAGGAPLRAWAVGIRSCVGGTTPVCRMDPLTGTWALQLPTPEPAAAGSTEPGPLPVRTAPMSESLRPMPAALQSSSIRGALESTIDAVTPPATVVVAPGLVGGVAAPVAGQLSGASHGDSVAAGRRLADLSLGATFCLGAATRPLRAPAEWLMCRLLGAVDTQRLLPRAAPPEVWHDHRRLLSADAKRAQAAALLTDRNPNRLRVGGASGGYGVGSRVQAPRGASVGAAVQPSHAAGRPTATVEITHGTVPGL